MLLGRSWVRCSPCRFIYVLPILVNIHSSSVSIFWVCALSTTSRNLSVCYLRVYFILFASWVRMVRGWYAAYLIGAFRQIGL